MPVYSVDFAGASVAVHYPDNDTLDFLDLLFRDLYTPVTDSSPDPAGILMITTDKGEKYILSDSSRSFFTGTLSVHFAAALFDQVIFHLLNRLQGRVALHSGAVVYKEGTVLLPGPSGSGKSTVSAWLSSERCSCPCSYLSDELVVLPENDAGSSVIPFPRPLCLKPGALAALREIIPESEQILADRYGAIVPHRLLNHCSSLLAPPRCTLILFPIYQTGARLHIEEISPARTSALLMACNVNARNLPDHGFRRLVQLARSAPAFQIVYSSFSEFNEFLPDLFAQVSGAV